MKNLTDFYETHKILFWAIGGLLGLFIILKVLYWLITSIGVWLLAGGLALVLYVMVKYFKVPIKEILK